nr:hypothetical protein [uncultured Duganella sp.]
MARIAICWESGGGMGHIAPLSLLAREMVRLGHAVFFIAKDIRYASLYLSPYGIPCLQAPLSRSTKPSHPARNHADIFLSNGYDDAGVLYGKINGWRDLFNVLRVDKVVCEFALTAVLAARSLGVPYAWIDNGFYNPPAGDPMPGFTKEARAAPALLKSSERRALKTVNEVFASWKIEEIGTFQALYQGDIVYRNWVQLNHFGMHSASRHFGQILVDGGGADPVWPLGDGPKLFAYVKSDNLMVIAILHAAIREGFRVLAYLPGHSEADVSGLRATSRAIVSDHPIRLQDLDDDVEIGIWQSPTGAASHSIEKKMRMIFLPSQMEQYLACCALLKQKLPARMVVGLEDWTALLRDVMTTSFGPVLGYRPADIGVMAKHLAG